MEAQEKTHKLKPNAKITYSSFLRCVDATFTVKRDQLWIVAAASAFIYRINDKEICIFVEESPFYTFDISDSYDNILLSSDKLLPLLIMA